jgi:ArsR family metal-binding transcriptional regulator
VLIQAIGVRKKTTVIKEAVMLIEKYDLDIFTPPCEPGAERYAAAARLTADISEVLPYLNATLRGAIYHRAANALTWKKGGHNVAFHAYEIATSNVEDRDAAIEELDGLIKLVNRTWERRAEITPDYETRQRPTPMAVYKLLPQTNCKRCGEPTCFTFALKLAASQKKIADCPPLSEPQHADRLAALQAIVVEAPAIG